MPLSRAPPSSPARPAASASASPRRSPRRAPTSSSTASATRPNDREEARPRSRRTSASRPAITPADMTKPDEIAAMVADGRDGISAPSTSWSTMPASSTWRRSRSSRSRSGTPSSPSTSRAAFHAIRAAVPGMKKRKWGRIINTASALAGRLAVQVRLRLRQARHRRAHQDGGARGRRRSASPSTRSAPATCGRRWSRSRSPTP